MTRPLLVFGAGGHGKVVADAAQLAGYLLAGFIDDDPARVGRSVLGLPVRAWAEVTGDGTAAQGFLVALAIGDNAARQRSMERLRAAGFEVPAIRHPSAVIARSATVGAGVLVAAGVVVNPDASVSDGAILNTGCVIEHDCKVGAFAHVSPGAALGGAVAVGDRSHVGLGAVILPGVRVGVDVRIGAGAAVLRDVQDGVTVVGVPARVVTKKG